MSPRRIQYLRQRRPIARRDAVAPVVVLFEVRRRDLQHLAFEHRRREPSPGVGRHPRRMRPAIHEVRIVDRPQPRRVIRGDLPGDRVDFLPDADLRRTARNVHRAVRPALPLRQRVEGRVPGLSAQAAGAAHRNADELADVWISGIVLVLDRGPFAGKFHLRVGGDADQGRRQQRTRAGPRGSPEVAHLGLLGMWPGSTEPGLLDQAFSLQPSSAQLIADSRWLTAAQNAYFSANCITRGEIASFVDVIWPNVALLRRRRRLAPLEPVERVERLDADLDALRVREPDVARQRHVDVLAARPPDAVARHRAQRAQVGCRNASGFRNLMPPLAGLIDWSA